jgi:23S rRNA (cytidine1920-2'-O)/16S rRNA (cytidine1409-2'-O)-methyltransferase
MARVRLDRLVHERGLAPSREKAQALILAGEVLVNGHKITKTGAPVPADAELRLLGEPPRYVSRAGAKLEAALKHFAIDIRGKVCLDVGSSTGGFTDCLLQHGAERVHAIDSGTNQMVWSLRNHPRVHLRERTNARTLNSKDIGEDIAFASIDVSFISVSLILPAVVPLLRPGAALVILIKPQFEAGRQQVGKGGIVRDESARQQAIDRVRNAAAECGMINKGVLPSPILGAEGNQEYLLYALKPDAQDERHPS